MVPTVATSQSKPVRDKRSRGQSRDGQNKRDLLTGVLLEARSVKLSPAYELEKQH
jgi:hypothetical protein